MKTQCLRHLLMAAWLPLLLTATPVLAEPPATGGSPPPGQGGAPQVIQAKQCFLVPGRNPDSNATWESFLGQAAHRLIAYMYGVEHSSDLVFYNRETIGIILDQIKQSKPSRLLPGEQNLCPDIEDALDCVVFEIKSRSDKRLQEGRQQVKSYLDALNRAVRPGKTFTGGVNFRGEILIRFAQGEYIWRLQWETTEPGVIQYQWTRSRERFESEVEAYRAGQWVELTVEEMEKYGGWVGQAVEGMVQRRLLITNVGKVVGIVITVAGNMAAAAFSGVIFGSMGSRPGAQQPPAETGSKILPFPQQGPPAVPPRAASGM